MTATSDDSNENNDIAKDDTNDDNDVKNIITFFEVGHEVLYTNWLFYNYVESNYNQVVIRVDTGILDLID